MASLSSASNSPLVLILGGPNAMINSSLLFFTVASWNRCQEYCTECHRPRFDMGWSCRSSHPQQVQQCFSGRAFRLWEMQTCHMVSAPPCACPCLSHLD